MKNKDTKVCIVGVGNVGSAAAYTILSQGLCSELVLINRNREKALGEALDMQHSVVYMSRNTHVKCGDYSDCADADIVIITAAAPMDKDADNRLDMLAPTKAVMKTLVENIMASGFDGVLIVISNPVDIMTYYAWKLSGLPKNQVIGTGTALDMARLMNELGELFDVDEKSVSAWILGEHGDSAVVAWSTATIGGKSLANVMRDNPDRARDENFERLRNETCKAGWEIFHRKGSTTYGIASAVAAIVRSILYDENRILPVSVLLEGQYGLKDIFLSTPTIINRTGAKEIVEVNLNEEEQAALNHSADVIRSFYDCL